jgi:hypothetical protein
MVAVVEGGVILAADLALRQKAWKEFGCGAGICINEEAEEENGGRGLQKLGNALPSNGLCRRNDERDE